MIPRVLHRVVPARTTTEVEANWIGFQRLHPDWELRTWRDPIDPADYEVGDHMEDCTSGASLADILRVEILWKYGGIYVDSDCEAVRAFDPLLAYSCFIGTEDGVHLTNAVMGCEPRHPAMRAYLDAILTENRLKLNVPPNESTGPSLATSVLGRRSDVTVLPPEFFYPYLFGDPKPASTGDVVTPFTYCVHHWEGSWLVREPTEPQKAHRRAKGAVRSKSQHAFSRVMRKCGVAVAEALPAAPQMRNFGTYVGQNRVLVSLPDGLRFRAVADDLSITPELVAHGMYDAPFWRFITDIVRPGDHVVDVGANVGLFSIAMAARVGRFGKVHAFEPDAELSALITENAAMNWMSDRVAVQAKAVADCDGQFALSSATLFRGNASAHPISDDALGSDHSLVEVVRLDEVLPSQIPLRLVKVDVEGGEWRVLAGMTGLLDGGTVQYLDVEVIRDNAGNDWLQLVAQLRRLVDRYDAAVSVLDHMGRCEPASLDHLIAVAGHHSHVIFQFR